MASIETRDRVYRALLSKLTLASDHRENLLGRGLTGEEIDRLDRIQSIHIRLDKKMKKGGKFLPFSSMDKLDGTGSKNWCHMAGPVRECVYLIEGYMKADIVHFFTGQTVLPPR